MAFKINGNTMSNQPSRVEVRYPDPTIKMTADGTHLAVEISTKRRLIVTWGVDGTKQAVTEELKTLRATSVVSVTWTDTDGSEATLTNAYMPQIPSDHIPGGDAAIVTFQGPISLTFYEM